MLGLFVAGRISFFKALSDGFDTAFRIFFQFAREEPYRSDAFREKFSELPFVARHVRKDLVLPVFRKLLKPSFFQFSVPKIPIYENRDFLSRKKHVWRAWNAPSVLPISEFRPKAFYERKKLFFRSRVLGFDPTHDVGSFFRRKDVCHVRVFVFKIKAPSRERRGPKVSDGAPGRNRTYILAFGGPYSIR